MALGTVSIVASSLFLIVTEILILAGNILIILAVANNKAMQSVTNLFVVNLSITDLFVAIFNCPLMLAAVLADGWLIGDIMCYVSGFLNVVFCCASILTLTAISIDRYYCITKPTMTVITKRKAVLMITSIWVIVIVFAVMPLLGWNTYVYVDERKHCMLHWQMGGAHSAYGVFLSVSTFVLPTWIMVFCYFKIFSTARKQAQIMAANRSKTLAGLTSEMPPSDATPAGQEETLSLESISASSCFDQENDSNNQPSSNTNQSPSTYEQTAANTTVMMKDKRERRTARVILIVIGVFQMCWLPYAALNQWSAFSGQTPPGSADLAASLLAYFNSGCNAVIYTKFNPRFRQAFAKLLSCGKRKVRNQRTIMNQVQLKKLF